MLKTKRITRDIQLLLLLVGIHWTAAACEETDEADVNDGGLADTDPFTMPVNEVPLRGSCTDANRVGIFEIAIVESYSMVYGEVYDVVNPANLAELVAQEGDCGLWQRRVFSCLPPCPSGQTCNIHGTCIPSPVRQDVGLVSIDGLAKRIRMESRPPGNNYFDSELPHPIFTPASAVRLIADGGFIPSFELYGIGVDPLLVDEPMWQLDDGKSLLVKWQPPLSHDRSRVTAQINVDQHGNSPLTLVCDWSDVGQAEISAFLIDQLLNAGVSGFPSGKLIRRTTDALTLDLGCVETVISAQQKIDVSVAGVVPCLNNSDCPPGLTCNTVKQICM